MDEGDVTVLNLNDSPACKVINGQRWHKNGIVGISMTFIFLVAALQILSSFAYSALTTAASAIYLKKTGLGKCKFPRQSPSFSFLSVHVLIYLLLCLFKMCFLIVSNAQSEISQGSRSPQGCRTPSRSWHHSTLSTKTFCFFNRSFSQTAVALTHIQTRIVQPRQKLASYATPSSERGSITRLGVTKERKDSDDDENKKKRNTKKQRSTGGYKEAKASAFTGVAGAGEPRIGSTERS